MNEDDKDKLITGTIMVGSIVAAIGALWFFSNYVPKTQYSATFGSYGAREIVHGDPYRHHHGH